MSVYVTKIYETYWRFAAKRQAAFQRRFVEGSPPPWTDDPIIAEHRFTNAYRASDRVSQYLIRSVIYRDDLPRTAAELFFRILLFKIFNRIDTWELLESELGPITWEDYDYDAYDRVLDGRRGRGRAIYTAAYMMPPATAAFGRRYKHQNHLKLLERMMEDRAGDRLSETPTMRRGYELLRSYPTMGDFLSYQFATDLNYSEMVDWSEMEFVVPGPGAVDGISKCFSHKDGRSDADVVRLMADLQEREFDRFGLDFPKLGGSRPLQLIDCQNLFCETDKYARVAHPDVPGRSKRTKIKQRFTPVRDPIEFFYPPKWGLGSGIVRRLWRTEIPKYKYRIWVEAETPRQAAEECVRICERNRGTWDVISGEIEVDAIVHEMGGVQRKYKVGCDTSIPDYRAERINATGEVA